MLGQRLRRWSNFKLTLVYRMVFAGTLRGVDLYQTSLCGALCQVNLTLQQSTDTRASSGNPRPRDQKVCGISRDQRVRGISRVSWSSRSAFWALPRQPRFDTSPWRSRWHAAAHRRGVAICMQAGGRLAGRYTRRRSKAPEPTRRAQWPDVTMSTMPLLTLTYWLCFCFAACFGDAVSTDSALDIITTTPDPCMDHDCDNGGTCQLSGSQVSCVCAPQWTGDDCGQGEKYIYGNAWRSPHAGSMLGDPTLNQRWVNFCCFIVTL